MSTSENTLKKRARRVAKAYAQNQVLFEGPAKVTSLRSYHEDYLESLESEVQHLLGDKSVYVWFERRLTCTEDGLRVMYSVDDGAFHSVIDLSKTCKDMARVIVDDIKAFYARKWESLKNAASKKDKPLTPREVKLMKSVNVFLMDFEMDGGVLPPDIERLSGLRRRLTPSESRALIEFFETHAPGSFS